MMTDMDMSLKRYQCKNCGIKARSKHLSLRSIHIDFNEKTMYYHAFMGNTCVEVADDPSRPARAELMNLRDHVEYCRIEAGKDLVIRRTIHEDLFEPPEEQENDPLKALMHFFRSIRECPEDQLKLIACQSLKGHQWERIEGKEKDDG
jgi:hypothetical protein